MSASNNFENSLLNLILNNVDITGIARGSSTAGNLYLSLHTGNPDETGTQETSEADYGNYSRVPIPRDNTQWSIVAGEAENTSLLSFPLASGGSNTVTYWGLGLDASGPGTLLLYGELSNSLDVSQGIRPIFDVNDLKIIVE